MSEPILKVDNLSVGFRARKKQIAQAVSSVTYSVERGETLAIVGESGSGKSVSALAILGLLPRTAQIEGSATFAGTDLLSLNQSQLREFRGKRIAMIFQDPMTAFHPAHTIGAQIAEAMEVHGTPSDQAKSRATDLLEMVGVPNPAVRINQYPHEYSGGMRQRAMVAMAIANKPDVLIADEPTTALDVTIQAKVMEVLADMQKEVDAALILITHDLGVVAGTADRIQVMYGGRIVERAEARELFANPMNPYTQGLLDSLPRLDSNRGARLVPIQGTPPSLTEMPDGCAFAPRCPYVTHECVHKPPPLDVVSSGHESRCYRTEALPAWTGQRVGAQA